MPERNRMEKWKLALFVIVASVAIAAVIAILVVPAVLSKQARVDAGNMQQGMPDLTKGEFVYPDKMKDAVPASRYYGSVEEAFENRTFATEEYTVSSEIMRIEDPDYLTVAYYFAKGDKGSVSYVVYKKAGGQFSNPIWYENKYPVVLEESSVSLGHPYTLEQSVAQYVALSMGLQNAFACSNDGKYVYLGYSQDPAIGKVSVMGRPPDGVAEFEDRDGAAWYLWYYKDLPAAERLSGAEGFSFGKFNLDQVIEILEVEVGD